ncbi:SWIM zinc finger family protein [Actinorugispora endophytica]|uniref:Putative Zn finger protein n=1 Tax=Actinorugispora endophytica TaxID=1605990 RepID=A0A4R6ULG9_9ACTN|nr:SWIM zinc finger family protein [Actinorugispora endophytica]TDQ46359.1 putative Zn finger protein [Actinorugispora endophytica]
MSGHRWWSARFVAALEEDTESGRLRRGRALADGGAVARLRVGPGEVLARVQGSRQAPYRVSLIFPVLDDGQWDTAVAALSGQPLFRARLLSGELPPEVERVFDVLGLPLFPRGLDDLVLTCSCPDWGDPCKHAAAALYTLADRLDEDPFLLTAWLGRNRTELLSAMRLRSRSSAAPHAFADAAPPVHVAARPLPETAEAFWHAPALPRRPRPGPVQPPPFPSDSDGNGLAAALAPLYARLTAPAPRPGGGGPAV